jgi:hypothetical protein
VINHVTHAPNELVDCGYDFLVFDHAKSAGAHRRHDIQQPMREKVQAD